MENIFAKKQGHTVFSWEGLGNIKEGRGDLTEDMPVWIYRLMQFTLFDIIVREVGLEKANEIMRDAGHLAGQEFVRNAIDLNTDFSTFVANLQQALQQHRVGILRMEAFDPETGAITLTVGQDLDCSGLPVSGETVCTYDEGFLAGILEVYTGKPYNIREVDCWASGDRVCRFKGSQEPLPAVIELEK